MINDVILLKIQIFPKKKCAYWNSVTIIFIIINVLKETQVRIYIKVKRILKSTKTVKSTTGREV